jgi:multimeric flavodoxin WrbA
MSILNNPKRNKSLQLGPSSLEELTTKLSSYKNILFLTTSSRWKEKGKSTQLAYELASKLPAKVIEVPTLNIHECEGNVSSLNGNNCGALDAELKDKEKNPTGYHRCWASVNNKDDELWVISKALFEADCVIWFSPVRWGQTNAVHQRLIERLTWIENRPTTLGEAAIPEVAKIAMGLVLVGHNWRDAEVLEVQKQVFKYFGFNTPDELSLYWQYTKDEEDESAQSYIEAPEAFESYFDVDLENAHK